MVRQGYPHRCPGCHNPKTHPFWEGIFLRREILRRMARNPMLDGITLGGEPFEQALFALSPDGRGDEGTTS